MNFRAGTWRRGVRGAALSTILSGMLLWVAPNANGQSIFDNGEGKGSVALPSGGLVQFAFGTDLATLTYTQRNTIPTKITAQAIGALLPRLVSVTPVMIGRAWVRTPSEDTAARIMYRRAYLPGETAKAEFVLNPDGTVRDGGTWQTRNTTGGRTVLELLSGSGTVTRTMTIASLTADRLAIRQDRLDTLLFERSPTRNITGATAGIRAKPDGDTAPFFGSDLPASGAGFTLAYGGSYVLSYKIPSPERLFLLSNVYTALGSPTVAQDIAPSSTNRVRSRGDLGREVDIAQINETNAQDSLNVAQLKLQIANGEPNTTAAERAARILLIQGAEKEVLAAQNSLNSTTMERIFAETALDIREDVLEILELQRQQRRALYPREPTTDLDEAITILETGTATAEQVVRYRDSQLRRGQHGIDFDQYDVRAIVDYNRFKLADKPVGDAAPVVNEKTVSSYTLMGSYSARFNNVPKYDERGVLSGASPIIFGVAAGWEHGTNAADIKTVGDTGALSRDEFKESDTGIINADLVYLPGGDLQNRIGLNLFLRTRYYAMNKIYYRPGFGVFLTEKGNTLKVIGGLSVSRGADNRARVDLVVGFNFGN